MEVLLLLQRATQVLQLEHQVHQQATHKLLDKK